LGDVLADFARAQRGDGDAAAHATLTMRLRRSLAIALFAFGASCTPTASQPPTAATSASPSAALDALFAAEWDHDMAEHPVHASRRGDRRFNDRWEDDSPAAIERRHRHDVDLLARLRTIDRAALRPESQLDYDLFVRARQLTIDGHAFKLHLLPVSQLDGIHHVHEIAAALRFDTLKDYDDWLTRLRTLPAHVDQVIALMREGMRARIVHPKVVMDRVPAQIDKLIAGDPEASALFKPLQRFPAAITEADRTRLTQATRDAIATAVVPAFRRMKDFIEKEYLPACFDDVGAWQLPDGGALYAYQARRYTTTTMTPDQIHATGLREVARIRREMQTVADAIGFKGTLQDLFAMLRTDPRFYFKSETELLDAYAALAKRIDPKLVKLFKTLPRMPYGVEPVPAAIAPDAPTAYYRAPAADGSRAGTFFINPYKPELRPKWEMTALVLHEAVPGHHLQIALAMERPSTPLFRQESPWSAFVEGWGLYAESLGDEMALYDDPYAKLGQLTFEMWRAVRLVVDTAMHHLKWDRRRAIEFFLENTPRQEMDVVNEVDRYVAWPGQALAYKIGQLQIRALRTKAQAALGARFDVREFHEVVLGGGAVPLDVLERRVTEWIERARR
jgi:uncharacterized protein (DUF885 family)